MGSATSQDVVDSNTFDSCPKAVLLIDAEPARCSGPEVANLGELIGILTSGGDFDGIWFSDVLNQLERMRRRLAELLTLIDSVMGPAL